MFPGGKEGRCLPLTTLPHSCADCLEIWDPQHPGNVRACLSRPAMGLLCLLQYSSSFPREGAFEIPSPNGLYWHALFFSVLLNVFQKHLLSWRSYFIVMNYPAFWIYVCISQDGLPRYFLFFGTLFNPLKPELNSICYLLALLAHHFLQVSRIRVKLLTFRRLMSYIYGAPILDVSRSHTTTQHSR